MKRPSRTTGLLLLLALTLGGGALWMAADPLPPLGWLPPQPAAPQARAVMPALPEAPPLARFAVAWQQPLFSPDRTPDPALVSADEEGLSDITLSGVLTAGQVQVALLRDADGRVFRLRPGEALPSGWQLTAVSATRATFSANDQTLTLTLLRPHLPDNTPARQTLPQDAITVEHQK